MDRFRNTGQPDWDWWSKLWRTPGATLRTLGVESGESVAEVGCGSGYFALPSARIAEPGRCTRSIWMRISSANSNTAPTNRGSRMSFRPTAMPGTYHRRSLPASTRSWWQTRCTVSTISPALFGRPFRAIEPGGSLLVVNWHDRPRETTTVADEPRGPPTTLRMTPAATEDAVLSASELTLDRQVELPPYHYALVFTR